MDERVSDDLSASECACSKPVVEGGCAALPLFFFCLLLESSLSAPLMSFCLRRRQAAQQQILTSVTQPTEQRAGGQ